MISLERAKALKSAGLKWEPEYGDWYDHDKLSVNPQIIAIMNPLYVLNNRQKPYGREYFTWLPRLDQLLAEIERRGWDWEFGILYLNKRRWYVIEVASRDLIKKDTERWEPFKADTPDDAAANAVLWILEQENHLPGAGGE